MRTMAFAARNAREIVRDPLSALFGIGFPVVLILLISMMKRSVPEMPAEMFGIAAFTPGMAVFGLSFLSLFLGMLIANDRSSAFLMRLFACPMTGADYILGYSLPMLPLALLQGVVCYVTALFFGLPVSVNLLPGLAGLLLGSLFTATQVGGAASILVNLAAWLSGTWFSLDMIGGVFRTLCNLLPFAHAVEAVKAAMNGEYSAMPLHLVWVAGYAVVFYGLAVWIFRRRMRGA